MLRFIIQFCSFDWDISTSLPTFFLVANPSRHYSLQSNSWYESVVIYYTHQHCVSEECHAYGALTRSSATAEIALDADDLDFSVDDVHSRSLKVIRCCAKWRVIYDFSLALNSRPNLTSIFNRSWDITPTVCISIPYLSFR